jgi:hypothetical protein
MSMNGSPTGAARSRSSSTASNTQQEPERPMSIASLRSKFESLAAGASGDGAGSEVRPRSRSGSQVRPISGLGGVTGDGRKSSTVGLVVVAVTEFLSSPSKRQLPDLPLPRRGRLNHHPPPRRMRQHDRNLYFTLRLHHPRYRLPSPQSPYSPNHLSPKRALQTSRRLRQVHHRPSLTADLHLQSHQSRRRK